MQKIITMLIVGIILYIMMDYKRSQPTLSKPNTSKTEITQEEKQIEASNETVEKKAEVIEGTFLEKSASKVLINLLKNDTSRIFIENMIRPMNESGAPSDFSFKINDYKIVEGILNIHDIYEGKGGKASCGHIATANFRITNLQNVIIDSGTKTFRLGSGDVVPALDNVIVGMRVGGVREGLAHARYAYGAKSYKGKAPTGAGEYYKINVTLTHLIPESFDDGTTKIFDDEISYKDPLMCGDHALFNAKIMKMDGDVVFDSKTQKGKIEMFLGDMKYPMIFSHALFNKTKVGARTVICKGKYLRSLLNKNSSLIFPKAEQQPAENQFYLIEFSDFGQ